MSTNDVAGYGTDTSTGLSGPATPHNAQGQPIDPKTGQPMLEGNYDKDGYPLPTGSLLVSGDTSQVKNGVNKGYADQGTLDWWHTLPSGAYSPDMAPPEPDSNNPYPRGSKERGNWEWANKIRTENQQRKAQWQKDHADQRKAPATGPAAPTTPFQSSGVDLTKQGKGENYIDSILKHYEDEGLPQTTNYSESALADFKQQQPANMDAYYDNASRRSANKINTEMAARGSYGSSNAVGQLMAGETDLRAQQARDEAGYGLSRFSTLNALSGAADAQNNNRSANELLWAKGVADFASKDQDLGQDRNNLLFNNNLALAGIKASTYGAGANAAISDVTDANDAANNATMGVASDNVSNAAGTANRDAATNKSVIDSGVTAGGNAYNYTYKPGSS